MATPLAHRNLPKDILPEKVLEETLSRRVNEVLGLAYARPILQVLHDADGPLGFRAIDVDAVGKKGSTKSTNDTLHRLLDMGWVVRERGKYVISAQGERALEYSRDGDGLDLHGTRPSRSERP